MCIEALKEEGLSQSSVAQHKLKIKQFYHFCFDETDNIRYRKILKMLKTKVIKKTLNPQDILTPEEVKRLINAATLERDRCLVAALFESGMRIGEIMAIKNSMVEMNEAAQEVTFHIPNLEGCKTGARTVVCLEIYGYVQDWMKCNMSTMFMSIKKTAIHRTLKKLFIRAGIEKPCYPHMFRHAAITNAVNLGMQENQICLRFWGHVSSTMLPVYITLSEQMKAQAYRNAKGMGESAKIINPLAIRCVQCGRLIQTGDLCVNCKENKELKEKNKEAMARLERVEKILEKISKVAIEDPSLLPSLKNFLTP